MHALKLVCHCHGKFRARCSYNGINSRPRFSLTFVAELITMAAGFPGNGDGTEGAEDGKAADPWPLSHPLVRLLRVALFASCVSRLFGTPVARIVAWKTSSGNPPARCHGTSTNDRQESNCWAAAELDRSLLLFRARL
jgi:hypothetical protein